MVRIHEAGSLAFQSASKCGAFKGLVRGLSNAEYHAMEHYYSSSDLKGIYSTSPKHFNFNKYSLSRPEKKTTEAMALGSLVHCLLLDPGTFNADFFIMPELNLRTKEGREERDHLTKQYAGKTFIDEEMISKAKDIVFSCSQNSQVKELLDATHNEASFFWECPLTHLSMRSKIDGYKQGSWFIELKTTQSATPDIFSRHAVNMNYDLSIAHYMEGIRAITGEDIPEVYFIVVETVAPYVCQAYRVSEEMILLGREKWQKAVTSLKSSMINKTWDGYFPTDGEIPMLLPPAWAVKKSEVLGGEDEVWESF